MSFIPTNLIVKIKKSFGFDVIPVHGKLGDWDDVAQKITFDRLSKLLDTLKIAMIISSLMLLPTGEYSVLVLFMPQM